MLFKKFTFVAIVTLSEVEGRVTLSEVEALLSSQNLIHGLRTSK